MKRKLFLFLLVLFSFFFVTGCNKKVEEKNDENTTSVEEVRALNEEEQKAIMEVIDDLIYLDYYGKGFKVSDLNNQEVLQFGISLVDTVEGLKFTDLESLVYRYLDFSLEPEDIICRTHYNVMGTGANLYLYDSSTGTYKYNTEHLGHGAGGYSAFVVNRYVSSTVKNDTYEVVVYKAFSSILGDVFEDLLDYYPSYTDAAFQENRLFQAKQEDAEQMLNQFTDLDKLTQYTYTFKIKDNHYVLIKYEIETKKEA